MTAPRPHAELAARLRNIECSLLDEDENATLREAADSLDALRADNTKLHSWLTGAEQYRGHLSRVRLEAAALRAENERMRSQLAEAQAALKTVMRNAELSKEPCAPDPESPAAIRNGKFASLSSIAAQGLGMVRGPSLTKQLAEAQRDAERYRCWRDAMIEDVGLQFTKAVSRALPDAVGVSRRPTAHEWDAAIDAAKGKTS